MAMNIGAFQSGGMDIGSFQSAAAGVTPLTVFTGLGRNDLVRARMFVQLVLTTGSLADLTMAELEALTSGTGHVDDLFYSWLGGLGYTGESYQDRLKTYLEAQGYTGHIDDMIRQAIIDGYYF